MIKKIILYVAIASVFSLKCKAQKFPKSGKTKHETIQVKYVYVNVIKTYERMAAKGIKTIDLLKQIADSYYNKSEYSSAAKWYDELFAMTSDLDPKYYYQYGQSMRLIGRDYEANIMLETFNQKLISPK